jgi:hypothetical protein
MSSNNMESELNKMPSDDMESELNKMPSDNMESSELKKIKSSLKSIVLLRNIKNDECSSQSSIPAEINDKSLNEKLVSNECSDVRGETFSEIFEGRRKKLVEELVEQHDKIVEYILKIQDMIIRNTEKILEEKNKIKDELKEVEDELYTNEKTREDILCSDQTAKIHFLEKRLNLATEAFELKNKIRNLKKNLDALESYAAYLKLEENQKQEKLKITVKAIKDLNELKIN